MIGAREDKDITDNLSKKFKGCAISVLYKRNTCWEIEGADYPIDARYLIRKVGKFISVYDGQFAKVKAIPPDLGSDDLIEKRRSIGTVAHYCRLIESKGVNLPTEPLGAEEEKEYIDALKKYASKGNRLSKANKSRLQLMVDEVVI